MPEIRDVLPEQNPWWDGEFDLEYKDRDLFVELRRYARMPHILALTGLRRTGKTTLLLRFIQDVIAGGLDPRNVLYFSFDEFRRADLREVLRTYESLAGRSVRTGRSLVVFDEVQKLAGWEDQLKALHDAYRGKVKFLISGSESLFIRRKSKETLAGRLFEFRVDPLSFREYLAFRGVPFEPLGIHEAEVRRRLDDYVRTQGFPEMVRVTDRSVLRRYLRESIVEKVLYRDLPALRGVRDPAVMESVLNTLMAEPGQLVEFSRYASDLGVSRRTLSRYFAELEQSFLAQKLYNYSASRRKVERKLRKYYPTIVSVDLAFRRDDLSRSRVFEWLVVTRLRAEHFWRDPFKHEVDIVFPDGRPVPVEVKSGRVDTDGLRAFVRRFGVRRGFVVTRELEGTRKVDGATVALVPAVKALLGVTKIAP